jgi:hypothetical protein
LVFGQTERKAISMALVDRALRWKELGEDDQGAPAQDEEFVLYHSDNIQATGFLEHIKLPHYVDFQSELELVRKLRREAGADEMREAEAGTSAADFEGRQTIANVSLQRSGASAGSLDHQNLMTDGSFVVGLPTFAKWLCSPESMVRALRFDRRRGVENSSCDFGVCDRGRFLCPMGSDESL